MVRLTRFFMKFKIKLSKLTSKLFSRYNKVSNKRVYNSGLGLELGQLRYLTGVRGLAPGLGVRVWVRVRVR